MDQFRKNELIKKRSPHSYATKGAFYSSIFFEEVGIYANAFFNFVAANSMADFEVCVSLSGASITKS